MLEHVRALGGPVDRHLGRVGDGLGLGTFRKLVLAQTELGLHDRAARLADHQRLSVLGKVELCRTAAVSHREEALGLAVTQMAGPQIPLAIDLRHVDHGFAVRCHDNIPDRCGLHRQATAALVETLALELDGIDRVFVFLVVRVFLGFLSFLLRVRGGLLLRLFFLGLLFLLLFLALLHLLEFFPIQERVVVGGLRQVDAENVGLAAATGVLLLAKAAGGVVDDLTVRAEVRRARVITRRAGVDDLARLQVHDASIRRPAVVRRVGEGQPLAVRRPRVGDVAVRVAVVPVVGDYLAVLFRLEIHHVNGLAVDEESQALAIGRCERLERFKIAGQEHLFLQKGGCAEVFLLVTHDAGRI